MLIQMLFAVLSVVIVFFEVSLYSMEDATKSKFASHVVKIEACDKNSIIHGDKNEFCYADDFYFSLTDKRYIDKKKLQEICKLLPATIVEMLLELCHFWSLSLPLGLSQDQQYELFTSLISECDSCVNASCKRKFHSFSDVRNTLLLFKAVCLLQKKALYGASNIQDTSGLLSVYGDRISRKSVELMGGNAGVAEDCVLKVLKTGPGEDSFDTEEIRGAIAKDYYLKHKKQFPKVSFKPIPLRELVAAETLEKKRCYYDLKNSVWWFAVKLKVLDLSKKKIADLADFQKLLAQWEINKADVEV